MSYDRYFAIKSGSSPWTARDIPGAEVVKFTLLGREQGGLCDTLEAVIPAIYPERYSIAVGDFVVTGWDSTAANHWFHGLVHSIDQGGPGSESISITAVGLENQLRSIYPVTNYGQDPGNAYTSYANPSTVGVDDIVDDLFQSFAKSEIKGSSVGASNPDVDATDASTDITYLHYDGSTSLYDILVSLAERTGHSWGFYPTTDTLNQHQFFFKGADSAYDPNFSKFTYGINCYEIRTTDSLEKKVNGLNVIGAVQPKLGRNFTRRATYPTYRSSYGPSDRTIKAPGMLRKTDLQIQAQGVFDRKSNPATTLSVKCFVDDTLSGAGPLISPGRTIIKIWNQYDSQYNWDTGQTFTDRINVVMEAHSIDLSFSLGEQFLRVEQAFQSAILGQDFKPAQLEEYDPAGDDDWQTDPDEVYADKANRAQVVTTVGVIESITPGDPDTAVVRADTDGSGGDESDARRELYTDIPIPDNFSIGDKLDLKHWFEDDELQAITTAAQGSDEGGSTVDQDAVIEIVRWKIATGEIPLYNTSRVRDIGNHEITGRDDGTLVAGAGGGYDARLGHALRVPAANNLALNSRITMVTESGNDPAYNGALGNLTIPGDTADMRLVGQVLGVTSNGEIALGTPSGGVVIVNVKTAAATARNWYLDEATDPVYGIVAAPLGAITQANIGD